MTESKIKLEYSGFIIFAAKIASVLTGLVFQKIVADALQPMPAGNNTEHDLWFNINDISMYFMLIGGILPFWVMRYVARGKEGAVKTGIIANLIIAFASITVFVPLAPLIVAWLNISQGYLPIYLLISVQILELCSISVLEACLQAKRPQAIGYGLLVQQALKVSLAYVLIVVQKQLLLGAVATNLAAFAVQIVYYLRLLANEFREKVRWGYVREWLRWSLANTYNVVGNQIATYVFLLLFDLGGAGARGSYGAATIVANVITYSSFLAYALYPKLLAEQKQEDVTTSLKMVMMFALPMTVGAVMLSESLMTMLGNYTAAAIVLVVLSIDSLVIVVSGLFNWVFLGIENVDEKTTMSPREFTRSRLFLIFSLPYVHSVLTIPTSFYILTAYTRNQPVNSAFFVSLINLVARFLMFLVLYNVVRKMVKISFPWRHIARYLFSAAVMGTILFIVPHPTTAPLTFSEILLILFETLLGAVVYLALLFAIDKEVRKMPRTVLHWVKDALTRS
ncbi:MAG: oligosaccharide flippase family protein [Candidatus Bathyarchaeia archaeon]